VLRLLLQRIDVQGWANRRTCVHPSKGGVRMCSPSSPPTPPRTCSLVFACSLKMFACSPLTPAHAGSSAVAWPLPRFTVHAAGMLASSASARCLPCCVALTAIASSSSATAVRQSVLTMSRAALTHGLNTKRGGVRRMRRAPLRTNQSYGARGSLCSQGAHASASSCRVCPRLSKDTKSVHATSLISLRYFPRAGGSLVPCGGMELEFLG
jgi:hypothetical protein